MKIFWQKYRLEMKNKLMGFLILAAILMACSNEHELPPDLVAQVNDAYLIRDNLNYRVPEILDEDVQLSMKKMLIKQWVEDEIIYQSALNEGLQLTESDLYSIENYKKSIIVQRYLDNKLNKNFIIPDKEIEDYYSDNKKEFVRKKDEVHVIHLFIENRDNAIFEEIKQAKNLLDIIKNYYFDTRSTYESPNGDLGYVAVESLPDIIQNSIKRQRTGSISDPLRSKEGFHFVQLMDFQKAGSQIELDLARDEIVRRLKWQRRGQEMERLLSELREKFQVQTYLSKIQ
jgi:parvulin-like peptidyl-prolyl isomerase